MILMISLLIAEGLKLLSLFYITAGEYNTNNTFSRTKMLTKSGFKKKKGGKVSASKLFLFIFKHGLNHPEMQRNFFSYC